MTDETPNAEGEPSPAAPEETPTAETKPLADEDDVAPAPAAPAAPAAPDAVAPTQPEATQAMPVAPAAAAAPAASAPAERPAGIFIPKWVGLVAAAIIAALVFGGIGYAIGDSSSDSGSSQNASVLPGSGNANGNGNGPFGNGRQFPNPSELPGGANNGNGNSNGNNNGGTGNSGGQSTSNGAFLGVAISTADNGVAVTEVQSGSPAADAGLKQGDVITAIDGTKVTTPLALRNAVQQHSSGDQITITYTRGGTSNTTKATLTTRSTSQSS